jgi:hypothetical protein
MCLCVCRRLLVPPVRQCTRAPTRADNAIAGMREVCRIPMSTLYPSYYHSFAITDSTLVFFEMPLKMNLFKMFTAAYISGKSFANAMEWDSDLKVCARVHTRTHGRRVCRRACICATCALVRT